MRFLKHFFAIVGLSLVALAAQATPDNPQNNVDYQTLPQPVATDAAKGKVEVVEFMWYNCPHCAAFNPILSDWVKKQGNKIDFKQVPIAFGPAFIPQQKLLFALEAMGIEEKVTPAVFKAIHIERRRVDTDKSILAFIQQQGIDQQKFLDAYNSFGVQAKLKRAQQLQDAYNIEGVPTIAVNGKYLTSPALMANSMPNQAEAVQQAATLKVLDYLVAKSASGK